MKRKFAVILLAAAMALSACGKVEKSSSVPDKLTPPTAIDDVPDSTAADKETTDEETSTDDEALEEYYNEILADGFGFEIYNDGHLADTWDYRFDAARIILGALAQPGTEQLEQDCEFTLDQLNRFESKGFMTHIKFENEKSFKVGDITMNGVCVMVAGDEGDYYFWIEYFDDNGDYRHSSYFIFDESYIPKLLDAVGYGDAN